MVFGDTMVKCMMGIEFTRHVLYIKIHKHTFFASQSSNTFRWPDSICLAKILFFVCVLSSFSASLLGFGELAELTTNRIAEVFGPQ